MGNPPLDTWAAVPVDTARLIFEQGDKYLSAQMQHALAADARALTVSAIFVGFATALYAATVGYWESTGNTSVLVSGLLTGTVMLVGAGMCGYAARPIDFASAGNEPQEWWPWTELSQSELLGKETENYQAKLDENNAILEANAWWLERGVLLSSLSPIVGLISWIGLWCLSLLNFPYRAHCSGAE